MNKLSNYILKVTCFVITALFISCEQKNLYQNFAYTTEIQVVFDWKYAPNVALETMRLYLFPLNGGKPQTYEFTDYRGGRIHVPVNRYRALCVNSDTESILYRNIDLFDHFEAYAPDGVLHARSSSVPRAQGTANERIVKSPDYLYSASLDDVTIEFSKKIQTVILFPEQSVCRYRVEIRNVSNLEYISADGISGALSSMSGGLLVGRRELSPSPVTVPFEIYPHGVSTLKANFLVFGRVRSMELTNKLVVYVIMTDGSKSYYTFDVSRQIAEAANPYDVYILLDGLPLPKPITNGDGFHPEIDEWQDIEVDVPM